jgi:hypothetical protein
MHRRCDAVHGCRYRVLSSAECFTILCFIGTGRRTCRGTHALCCLHVTQLGVRETLEVSRRERDTVARRRAPHRLMQESLLTQWARRHHRFRMST